jgi:catechol 2,3-dioxygenase-like lactoylglutathione lyase family enzyme
MRSLLLFAVSAATMLAQIPAQNASGIGIGHVHLMTADPDAMNKVLIDVLGAKEVSSGSMKMLKVPGLFIMTFKGTPSGGSEGSSMNHIGFVVKDYADAKAKLTAAGAKQVFDIVANKQLMYEVLDGVRLELFEDPMIPTTAPATFHHMHLSVPDPDVTRGWYVKEFAAESGSRRNLPAAMFPGGEVDFLKATAPRGAPAGTVATVAPTKGRSIDHIGFEVKDLKAVMDKLKADGVTVDSEMRDMTQQIKLKIAFVVDPVGTRIELTQGLAGQ